MSHQKDCNNCCSLFLRDPLHRFCGKFTFFRKRAHRLRYWIMFVAYGLALACYTVHTGGDYTKRRTRWGPPCSICGSIPFLAHHPVFAQAVRFLGILADAFKQCTAIRRKTTAKGGKDGHFWIRDITRLSTFMGCGLE